MPGAKSRQALQLMNGASQRLSREGMSLVTKEIRRFFVTSPRTSIDIVVSLTCTGSACLACLSRDLLSWGSILTSFNHSFGPKTSNFAGYDFYG
jgi:hypothetical protein